jgi:hypothetical protein
VSKTYQKKTAATSSEAVAPRLEAATIALTEIAGQDPPGCGRQPARGPGRDADRAAPGPATHAGPDVPLDQRDRVDDLICRDHSRNVKRWRDGQMPLRWCAAGMVEAGKQFRRVNGHLHLAKLRAALDAEIAATVAPAVQDEEVVAA